MKASWAHTIKGKSPHTPQYLFPDDFFQSVNNVITLLKVFTIRNKINIGIIEKKKYIYENTLLYVYFFL